MRSGTSLAALLLLCGCGGREVLVQNSGPSPTQTPTSPTHHGGGGGGGTPACTSDCDCASGTRCQPATGEAPAACVIGQNTCPIQCSPACGAYQQCNTQTGQCVPLQCPTQVMCGAGYYCDTNGTCQANATEVSVDGVWKTAYSIDVHQFAQNAGTVLVVLNLLDALLTGQGNCTAQSTPEGQLLCYIFDLVGAQIQAPPWVGQLLQVLEDLFKYGSSPVTAQGVMTITQGANQTLSATESWSSLIVSYNGQQLDLMSSPVLGSSGNVNVSVQPFGGTRDPSHVMLGPRQVSLDVNHFIIALVDVAIDAATNGQASDIGGLLEVAICNPLPQVADQLACDLAVNSLTSNISITSSQGGLGIDHQDAPIIGNVNNVAQSLATPTAPAALIGSMSNGLVSGNFGPTSSWYGTR